MQLGRPLSFFHARRSVLWLPQKWRQCQEHLDDPVTSALQEAVTFLEVHPVRVHVLAYSDASWWDFGLEDETKPPRLGWLYLWPDGGQAFTAKLTRQVVRKWLPRKQQIMCAEPLAPLIALHHSAERLANQEVLCFVDNLGAVSRLIRRAARPEAVGHIASTQATLAGQLSTRVWCESVDSASDPSDGLSRVGVDCPLQPAGLASARGGARLGFCVLPVWAPILLGVTCQIPSRKPLSSSFARVCLNLVPDCVGLLPFFFWSVVGLFDCWCGQRNRAGNRPCKNKLEFNTQVTRPMGDAKVARTHKLKNVGICMTLNGSSAPSVNTPHEASTRNIQKMAQSAVLSVPDP